jgi:hypothetical protein
VFLSLVAKQCESRPGFGTRCTPPVRGRGPESRDAPAADYAAMSLHGDLKQIRKRAEQQGWRVEKRKEFWLY